MLRFKLVTSQSWVFSVDIRWAEATLVRAQKVFNKILDRDGFSFSPDNERRVLICLSIATGTTLGSGSRRNEIISFSSFCFRTNLFRAVFVHFRNLAAVPEKWPQPEIYCTAPPPSVSKAENNWVKIFARLLMTLIRVSFDPLVVWLMIQLTTNRMDTSVTHHTFLHEANSWDLFGWPS